MMLEVVFLSKRFGCRFEVKSIIVVLYFEIFVVSFVIGFVVYLRGKYKLIVI